MAHLEQFGSLGYQVGAVGIVAMTVVFLVIVRWYTDLLGRVLATVLGSTSLVLVMVGFRQLGIGLPGNFFVWRAVVFWLFGVAVWAGLSVMIWAQFFAPRVKNRGRQVRMTTLHRRGAHEESDLADPGDRDYGGLHDGAGRADR